MVERLSEGDIDDRKKEILKFEGLENGNFYHYIESVIKKNANKKLKNCGLAVFFDVFSFNDVISILRKQYNLNPTDEEIRIGDKFSFVLYFDKDMNLQKDMIFFTECGYLRYFEQIPSRKEFKQFEDEFKNLLEQKFDGTSNDADGFNTVIRDIMRKYNFSTNECRLQFVYNIETVDSNLHSFFIDDLEAAKKIDTSNLTKYLFGDSQNRVNLDSKSDSVNFNPEAFKSILKPCNYPLGRFPGNPDYALSFMQQVAVNLSTGYDHKSIRSVNGPPGTGKTTLLKDVFAQLIVEQAYDIVSLDSHEINGTDRTLYFEKASIGVLPENISEKSIVVASSNNGAVQNIVNELPLREQISEAFIDELLKVDYFHEIANSKVSVDWIENESGNSEARLKVEPSDNTDRCWGLFSLEGGKKNNTDKILNYIKIICEYLNNEYIPDTTVYRKFLDKYKEVNALREKMQKLSDNIEKYNHISFEFSKQKARYETEYRKERYNLDNFAEDMKNAVEEFNTKKKQEEQKLQRIVCEKDKFAEEKRRDEDFLQLVKKHKPGLFASRTIRKDYREKVNEALNKIEANVENIHECDKQSDIIRKGIMQLQNKADLCNSKLKFAQQDFENWNNSENIKISKMKQQLEKLKSELEGNTNALDMNQSYEKLQLSNPWFDKSYRIAQSELFIKALAVRKQFLYENKKNLQAARNIWINQNKYLEKNLVIEAAWGWINMAIPVISSTLASFSRMCRNLKEKTLGHLFIDEAGQAVPQAAVGAIFRSRHVMALGDPSQIKPVLTLDSSVLGMLGKRFGVTEKYLSDSASTQTLVDASSDYGFYREQGKSDNSWIGIPLWVHRRCQYPMFTISNIISYNGLMVQGKPGNGKTGWFDIKGKADNKYVKEYGEFLLQKIKKMSESDPDIKDKIYVITPFTNVAYQLAKKLNQIKFTKYVDGKPINVGTIHTFQGKEADVVFLVLGADTQSKGAARWAVNEPNMMNVAASRAKKEFYIIGDKKLYLDIGSGVVLNTYKVINQYKKDHPELIDEDVKFVAYTNSATDTDMRGIVVDSVERLRGKVRYVGNGKRAKYAYVEGDDGKEYTITEHIYKKTENADVVIKAENYITFVPKQSDKSVWATEIKSVTMFDCE